MLNPWDPFPMPKQGDLDCTKTFEGIGRVTDRWEAVEFNLARLYSIFVADPDGEALSEYGKPRIFRDRLRGVRNAAAQFFISQPNQHREGTFDALCAEAEGFSERRNEVAHGTVMPINKLTIFRDRFDLSDGREQFLVIPPLFSVRNHNGGLPAWAYSFEEMWELMARLLELSFKIDDYRRSLIGLPPRPRGPLSETHTG